MRVLSTAGCSVRLPAVSIVDEGPFELRLKITHVVRGLRRTEVIELTRDELRLVGEAVFRAMVWPEG